MILFLKWFLSVLLVCNIVPIFIFGNKSSHLRWNRQTLHSALYSNWTLNIRNGIQDERARICLKNTTKCISEDQSYEAASGQLAKYLFSGIPPLDLSKIDKIHPKCRKESALYINELKSFNFWALKMYDSSAKLPSGILNGNINQLGDFDMCLSSNEPNLNMYGKYCLASLQIETGPFTSPYIAALHRLAHAHYHFKTRLSDPEHRVPQFSSTKWAICMPSACTARDLEIGLRTGLAAIFKNTELKVSVKINADMCQSLVETKSMGISSKIAWAFFVGFALFAAIATAYDYTALYVPKNEWIMAFSIRKNLNSMIGMKRSSDDIEAIHGIRCVNAIILLMAHKTMALFFQPYSNRTEMVEILSQPWSALGRAASLYTDPFIMISATLTAYSLFGKLLKTGTISIAEEYMSRLLRIVPTFAALIAFCTLCLPGLGSGPMWNLVVAQHANICRQNWWRNLLFIHNYYGFGDMCLTHTHHIGIDTQLFFISPLLVWILWKWPKRGGTLLIASAGISTLMRYQVTQSLKLSNYVHFGTSIKQLFDTADNMYILPVHRLTVYIMGVFLGYILRTKTLTTLTPNQLKLGNAAAVSSFAISFWGNSFMGNMDYRYNSGDAAWYAAFSPILWCFTFAWIIFTTHIGHRGFLNRFFSARIFLLWTKISYTVYLTQFPIFFYNVGITRTSEHYGLFRMMFNVKEFTWIIGASLVLTLLFECPFQNVRNIFFIKKRGFRENIPTKKVS